MQKFRGLFGLMLALGGSFAFANAVPFWGSATSMPAGTPPESMRPGDWVWQAAAAPAGPIVLIVSLDEQRTYAFRNGVLIGYASSSTGKPGHETPTGVFMTLQKDADHHSKTYNNAPMPYQQRLTWDGVALHAGRLPGYPSSHGCVHLPSGFAKVLFDASPLGMTVVVAAEKSSPVAVAHPLPVAPVDPQKGQLDAEPALSDLEAFRWQPDRSATGPLSLVLSRSDQRVVVLRNGVEIGRAKISLVDGKPFDTHAFVAHRFGDELRWTAVSIPGHEAEEDHVLDASEVERVRFPAEFLQRVLPLVEEGTSLVVTELPIVPHTTGAPLTVLAEAQTEAAAD